MPRKKRSITKLYTLRQFMRGLVNLKISDATIEDFIRELDELATKVTVFSGKLAREEDKKTIMPQHLQKALDEVLRRGPLTVEELLQKIDPLSVIELSQLAEAIKKKAQELLKRKHLTRGRRK